MLKIIDLQTKKLVSIFCGIFLLLMCIIVRLIYLQIYLLSDYAQRAKQNFLRVEKIVSRRGNIYDCNNNLLATNRPITSIYWPIRCK